MYYRNECKHALNYMDYLVLRQRLRALMQPDPHAGPQGRYFVRSLYFDDIRDSALMEKRNGVNERDKFRIRFYNLDTSVIHLEKKSKRGGMCLKRTASIDREQAEAILAGDWDWMPRAGDALLAEFYVCLKGGLLPRAVVDYMREPFVYEPGNVRITLDYDVRTGAEPLNADASRFLRADFTTVPAGSEPIYLLEVKWDEFLPAFLQDAVRLPGRRTAPFSKYAACRIYG